MNGNVLRCGSRIMLRSDMVSRIGEHFRAGRVFTVFVEGLDNVRVTDGTCTPWLAVGSIEGARARICGIPAYGPGMPILLVEAA